MTYRQAFDHLGHALPQRSPDDVVTAVAIVLIAALLVGALL